MKKAYEHLIGSTFNGLTFKRIIGPVDGYTLGEFRCECGTVKSMRIHSVLDGNTKSCGCRKTAATKRTFTTHGKTNTPEYRVYHEMRKRCLNPNNDSYDRYGGRGIVICARWLDSFEAFLSDMGERPTAKHSLDRINNEGNYEPGNVRWATAKDQGNNRRSTRLLTAGGRTMSHKAWAEELGVSPYMVRSRAESGMSGDEVVAALTGTAP